MLKLRMALHANDHHRNVLSQDWQIPGAAITPVPLAPGEMYSRVFDAEDLDIVEMSIARYARLRSEGKGRLIAAPYYFSRVFPHKYFYVRTDFPGRDLSAIKGMRVGLSEYDHTGHTWARILLEDGYAISPADVSWICARRETSKPPLKHDFVPPAGVSLTYAPAEKTLSQMLLDGEIDVLLNPNSPSCFAEQPERVRRLLDDPRQSEVAYLRAGGLCPIQHVLGIRRELASAHPNLIADIIALLEAQVGRSRSLWAGAANEDNAKVALSGLAAGERRPLQEFLTQHHRQGMSKKLLSLEDFFGERV
ncbi:hypothetical protein V8J36_20710 [Frigidibacter sp. MR17.14]|uniref:hypothetical protein n=1 Tax=Frigidibacter sp. MR17.14 TaxID=3126509 RepID=UPI0030130EA0